MTVSVVGIARNLRRNAEPMEALLNIKNALLTPNRPVSTKEETDELLGHLRDFITAKDSLKKSFPAVVQAIDILGDIAAPEAAKLLGRLAKNHAAAQFPAYAAAVKDAQEKIIA